MVTIGALSALAPISTDIYLPGLPQIGRDLGASTSATQATLSGCLIGLAVGQVIAGPASDILGRRRPLLAGISAYVLLSLLCAFAPDIGVLVALRVLQGVAGAAGVVIGRAMVRDITRPDESAKLFSTLMLVTGLAPILGPIAGGMLLRVTSWRGAFVFLAVIGLLIVTSIVAFLPETLPAERRRAAGARATFMTFRAILRDDIFVAYTAVAACSFATMFAYISGSSFVLENRYGLSPQQFSVAFGLTASGMLVASQINRRLLTRFASRHLLFVGVTGSLAGSLTLFIALDVHASLVVVQPALALIVASAGFTAPNVASLAMARQAGAAGSASSLIGLTQFSAGALAGPLTGIGRSGLAMGVIVLCCSGASMTFALRTRRVTRGDQRRDVSLTAV
jgi:DHA1 family bicyclomycin/chloramphenicol resistance-like MFS transporter